MAGYSKEKFSKLVKQRLECLECPFTQGVDDSWITELIFTPGEHRIRLLQWLFSKFDSKLNEHLDPQFCLTGHKTDSRLQRLLFVASSLGLCAADDADLIKGCSTTSRQVSFITQLLDLVYVCHESEESGECEHSSPDPSGPKLSLTQQWQEDCMYVNQLAAECDTAQMFAEHCPLLPPDIGRQLKPQQSTVPDESQLDELIEKCSRDLDRQTERLQRLREETIYSNRGDASAESKSQTTLRLALIELQQLLQNFSHCYSLEIQPWCHKERPHLTRLGAQLHKVNGLLGQFTQLLESISSIHEDHNLLSTQIRTELEKILRKEARRPGVSVGYRDTEFIQRYMNILEDSLARLELSSMNSSHASGFPANLTISTIKADT